MNTPTSTVRMPAEWAPHRACWLAYPFRADEWGDHLVPAQREYLEFCRAIRGERLELLVPDEATATQVAGELAGVELRLHVLEYGDSWTRDTGPIFTLAPNPSNPAPSNPNPSSESSRLEARCFEFNGWGGKYLMPGDPEVNRFIAGQTGATMHRIPWVLEGGGIEVDGEGTLLTTRQCLLNPNRNPTMSQAEIEAGLREQLGVQTILWLDQGLAGDHTDGHIDTLARFVRPGVVIAMEPASSDPNAEALQAILDALESFEDAGGRRLDVLRLPSPGAVRASDGSLLPASYCNFYISNQSVVVPTYDVATDERAVAVIREAFPDRDVVGRSARAILTGGGAFHCMTQQEPRSP